MTQAKADKLLNRITALHRSLQLDDQDDAPSTLERDLMLGYLRDLYTIYLEVGDDAPREKPKTTPKEIPPAPPKETPKPPDPPKPTAPPPPQPQPEVPAPERPNPTSPPEFPDAPVPPPQPPAMATHTAKIEPRYDERPAPDPPQPAPAPNASPDVEALFAETDSGSDLGNRLGRQRVADLNRALSINNRVLFANKLFNGNDELNDVLKSLNLKGSMSNAKPLLIDLAQQHRWAAEEREETAREFIELVRRRYA
ncbi:hypothetical protein CLV84_0040 [Neolewinella xylanilytica]|uniref:Uncharacterized protein n=1 Tax=Neolewinella xylanilytica TaxID=1514080 RepID=A0A2S6I6I7_9BACT|nr:hypothetical protein [Neolewinella xylanilytica]PPK87106.1 hypothetical protein CLV84_0040 [Neolewinella xylanilytica]